MPQGRCDAIGGKHLTFRLLSHIRFRRSAATGLDSLSICSDAFESPGLSSA